MSARRQAWDSYPSSDLTFSADEPRGKKVLRDEEKSKEQLIEEMLELRQRIAELEELQEKKVSFIQGEISFVKRLPKRISHVKTLSGLLPICTSCKKIRDDGGYWTQLEIYIREHSDAEFSHGLCPECVKKYYPVDILTRNSSDSQPDNT